MKSLRLIVQFRDYYLNGVKSLNSMSRPMSDRKCNLGALIRGLCGQRRRRLACAFAQVDLGLRCPLAEWLDDVDYIYVLLRFLLNCAALLCLDLYFLHMHRGKTKNNNKKKKKKKEKKKKKKKKRKKKTNKTNIASWWAPSVFVCVCFTLNILIKSPFKTFNAWLYINHR